MLFDMLLMSYFDAILHTGCSDKIWLLQCFVIVCLMT